MQHGDHASRPHVRALGAAIATALVLTACSGTGGAPPAATATAGDSISPTATATDVAKEPSPLPRPSSEADAQAGGEEGGTAPGEDAAAAPTPEPPADQLRDGTAVVAAECRPAEGVEIEHLPDRWIGPTVVETRVVDGIELDDGEVVGAFEVPGFTIDGVVVDGGCIIRHDAPGGCLGRVEITGVAIPDVTIPDASIPSVTIGGETAEGDDAPGVRVEGVTVEGAVVEQQCRVDPDPDDRNVPAVQRPAVQRAAAQRSAAQRPAAQRRALTTDEGRISSAFLSSVFVPSVLVPSVFVPSAILPSVVLDVAPDVETFADEDETAFVLEADVLFDFDSDQLRPEAETGLRQIVAALAERHPDGPIEVGGHTDSLGDDAYNQDLSERRAATVLEWLVAQGGIARERLTARGFGETAPVAPNETADGQDDPEGRQQNRRVVVSATG